MFLTLTLLLALMHWLIVVLIGGFPRRYTIPYLFAILTFWSAFFSLASR